MCGIFGYVGPKNAGDIILEGLKGLEYRGYDTWGIAVKSGKEIVVNKHIGKIGQAKTSLPASNLGIGHTRWATHGGVTVENAHPHLDCTMQIAVLHNGIIENFAQLKEGLVKKGHKFVSETDTEVASHLIEEYLKEGKGFASSVRDSFNKLQGMNAIVVLNASSSEIIAAKNGSPLVIGMGKNEYLVASDAAGILKHTKKVLFLEDNQMVILGSTLQLLSLPGGSKVEPKFTTLTWKFEEVEKGTYKHFFIKEIHEEPQVIKRISVNAAVSTKTLANYINKASGTFMIACGSASYAAIAGTYLFSKVAKKQVNMAIGSEFKYIEDFVTPKTLVIPISQSGESIDVIEPVTRVKKKGATIASLVNVLGSTLYRISDFNVLLESGTEKAVVATKSFTAMVATLILTSYTLAGKQEEGQKLLTEAAKDVKRILQDSYIEKIKKLAEKINTKDHLYIIGRGLAYTAALEATLKLKEASYAHAEAFPGGELKHGVIALIEKGTPCIVFAPNDETYDEIISNAQEVRARGGYIIGIGPKNNQAFDYFLETEDIKEATLLSQVTVSHLLGYYLSLARGVENPDMPRNLAKSVTVK